jgi:hypothetical protein
MNTEPAAVVCAQCELPIADGEAILASGRHFCASCYAQLRAALEQIAAFSSSNVNYPGAALGATLGGAAGAVIWWGFTVITHVGLGLVAVVIGYLAGHGAMRLAGNKRTQALQAIAALAAAVSFFAASYLVNMTLINEHLASRGDAFRVPFPPASLAQTVQVISIGFQLMDMVFLVIVVMQAWSIPRPLRVPASRP